MSMSKKHFEALADGLHNLTTHDDGETVNVKAVREMLVSFCAYQNSQFDRTRFLHRATTGHNLTKACCGGSRSGVSVRS